MTLTQTSAEIAREKAIRKFITGELSVEDVTREQKISRATVYRLARTIENGGAIVDLRRLGNRSKNRKSSATST